MATNADQRVGLFCLLVSATLFIYYTTWVIVTPFVDEDHVLQSYFPPRIYAIVTPTLLLVFLVCGVIGFFAYVMIQTSKETKLKSS